MLQRHRRRRLLNMRKNIVISPHSPRNVTLDSNVLIQYVTSKKEGSMVRRAVLKSILEDRLQLTDIIFEECVNRKRKSINKTCTEIAESLLELPVEIIVLNPIPSVKKLAEKYYIRDPDDLKILYSADMTDSVILVTDDHDFNDINCLKSQS